MARTPTLKVFRTPIGFHDAYVAAASQKAALEAWGSDTNLFAQKSAELVTDPALTAEPLAQPGVVIKRMRGTKAEQLAALGPDKPRSKVALAPEGKATPKVARPKPQPKPRPDRSALDQAEQAAADLEKQQAAEQRQLREKEAELARQRREMDKAHRAQSQDAENVRAELEAAYEEAMRVWRRDTD